VRDGVVAGAAGATLSGLPSTVIALARGDDIFDSTRAVGRVLLPDTDSDVALLAAGAGAHAAISVGWGVVLSSVLPRRHTVLAGALAAIGIAALDLGFIGRRLPTIAALDPVPEVLDHVAYGMVVGAVLRRRRAM
jgi:hypothetical protein